MSEINDDDPMFTVSHGLRGPVEILRLGADGNMTITCPCCGQVVVRDFNRGNMLAALEDWIARIRDRKFGL